MLHLRRLGPGGIFSRFAHHFESVWVTVDHIGSTASQSSEKVAS